MVATSGRELDSLLKEHGLTRSRQELQALDKAALDALLKADGLKLGPRMKILNLLLQAPLAEGTEPAATPTTTERIAGPPAAAPPTGHAEACEGAPPADLDEDTCVSLLTELNAAYRSNAFVAALQKLNAMPGSGVEHGHRNGPATDPQYTRQLSALVLEVQKPLLRRFGLPPDASGVARMKGSVHRRRVEQAARGEFSLLELANESRFRLGLTMIRDTRAYDGLEDLCAKQLAGEADGSQGVAAAAPGGDAGAEPAIRRLVARALEAGRISRENAAYIESQLGGAQAASPNLARTLLLLSECGLPHAALTGQDVASTPELFLGAPVVLDRPPSAADFFEHFVKPSRPAVLRGVLDATRWAPLANFADFGYLRRRCGHRRVLVKALGLADQAGRRVFVSDPELKLRVVDWLDMVEAAERDGTPCPFYLGKVPLRTEVSGPLPVPRPEPRRSVPELRRPARAHTKTTCQSPRQAVPKCPRQDTPKCRAHAMCV